jgi:hypothetical protein
LYPATGEWRSEAVDQHEYTDTYERCRSIQYHHQNQGLWGHELDLLTHPYTRPIRERFHNATTAEAAFGSPNMKYKQSQQVESWRA